MRVLCYLVFSSHFLRTFLMPPMNVLALETSSERLSVALVTGDVVFARDVDAGQQHSALALGVIRDVFAEAQLTPGEIDLVAFGQGPGSFVGVRIACGLAQGLALGAGKLVVPVPTTLALAEQVAELDRANPTGERCATVLVAIDARLGEIYFAAYRPNDASPTGWDTLIAPVLTAARSLPKLSDKSIAGIGSAFAIAPLREALVHAYGAQLTRIVEDALPRATDVARVAQRQSLHTGAPAAFAPEDVAPLYLRDNVALTIAERAQVKLAASGVAAGVVV
jgi:tRNA threonylcarbamoyladenosine biosynthesis protein TsaB